MGQKEVKGSFSPLCFTVQDCSVCPGLSCLPANLQHPARVPLLAAGPLLLLVPLLRATLTQAPQGQEGNTPSRCTRAPLGRHTGSCLWRLPSPHTLGSVPISLAPHCAPVFGSYRPPPRNSCSWSLWMRESLNRGKAITYSQNSIIEEVAFTGKVLLSRLDLFRMSTQRSTKRKGS